MIQETPPTPLPRWARVLEIVLVIVFMMVCSLAAMRWLVDLFTLGMTR